MGMFDNAQPYLVAFTLDFETGGLYCQTSAVTQIALHATRLDTWERIGRYVEYIYPYRGKAPVSKGKRKILTTKYEDAELPMMEYNQRALEYSAISMDMLYDKGADIDAVASGVLKFIKEQIPPGCPKNMKPFFIGQNIAFDIGFLMQMMERIGGVAELSKLVRGAKDYYGNWQPLVVDTITLAQLAICHKPNVTAYDLGTICGHLGVEIVDAHDADADVAATTGVAETLAKRMRGAGTGVIELASQTTEKKRHHFKI